MNLTVLWPLLIPTAFLALLIVMLVRQRRVDRLYREAMRELEDDRSRVLHGLLNIQSGSSGESAST
jgi:hypothetical protein